MLREVTTGSYLLALAGATVAGLAMGVGPERKGRAAGLRTHMYVAVGGALFALLARELGGAHADPLRAVQGVALGVGFVGAATVLRRGERVHGVSTAAQIWVTAALGTESGYGHPFRAVALSVVIALLSMVLRRFERDVLHTKPEDPSS